MGEITELLGHWHDEKSTSRDRLYELVYRQLRAVAAHRLRSESPNHTLATTELVHEAYLRLHRVQDIGWKNRAHFLAIAALAMRRVLLDHARERLTDRRGRGQPVLPLEEACTLAHDRPAEYIRLAESLAELARVDPAKASIVQLRYFTGLTLPEAASVLGVSRSTAARHWKIAMGWLHRELSPEAAEHE